MDQNERIQRLEELVWRLSNLVDDLARWRHEAQEHSRPYPNNAEQQDCGDGICSAAWALYMETKHL